VRFKDNGMANYQKRFMTMAYYHLKEPWP